jgi:hypothetical protein
MKKVANFIVEQIEKLGEKYNVVSMRNGKEVTWNHKPLSDKEADEMVKDLEKAKIPSVDQKTIKKVEASALHKEKINAQTSSKKTRYLIIEKNSQFVKVKDDDGNITILRIKTNKPKGDYLYR